MTSELHNVHIVFGEVARAHLRLALADTASILVQRDPLSFGRVEEFTSIDEWKARRNTQLNHLYQTRGVSYLDGVDELAGNVRILADADKLTLWCGVGIEDQLLKMFVVRLLRYLKLPCSALEIRQLMTLPNLTLPATTVGYVEPGALLNCGVSSPMTDVEADSCLSLWRAYTANTPAELVALHSSVCAGNMLLRASRRLFKRYPADKSGLNYWQYFLLKSAQTHRHVHTLLSLALDPGLDPYDFVSEAYLLYEMRNLLANTENSSLLALTEGDELARDSEVQITTLGHEILRGRAAYTLAGSDRWVGGVALASIQSHSVADALYWC